MPDPRSIALRTVGFLGALLVVMSTFVAWYDFDVAFATRGVAHEFVVPVDLWSLYPLAAALEVDRLPANVQATTQAATHVDGGAFMALLGGIFLCLGALGVLMPSATPARAPSDQGRVAPA